MFCRVRAHRSHNCEVYMARWFFTTLRICTPQLDALIEEICYKDYIGPMQAKGATCDEIPEGWPTPYIAEITVSRKNDIPAFSGYISSLSLPAVSGELLFQVLKVMYLH